MGPMTEVNIRFCGRLVYLFFDFHTSFWNLRFIVLDTNVDFPSPKLTSKTEVFKLANHYFKRANQKKNIYIYIYISSVHITFFTFGNGPMTAVDIRFCGRLVYLFFDFHASFCDLGFIALDKNVDFSSPKLTSKTEVFKLANHIYIYIYIYI